MLKRIIKIIDCGYWLFVAAGWFFKGIAEILSAASGFLKEFDSDE